MQIRRTLAAGALSAVALSGLAAAPAAAEPLTETDCAGIEQTIADAKGAARQARQDFVASKRPLGKLMRVERREARAEARQSSRALKGLIKEIVRSGPKQHKALLKQLRTERRELAQANRLLSSKRALRAEVFTERREARQTWAQAQRDLRELRVFRAQTCEDDADTGTDTGADTGTGTGA